MIVTYKPGWSFEWVEHNEGDFLNITVGKPDAKGTDAVTGEGRSVSFLLRSPADLDFRVWLHRTIGEIEAHEAAEWLRVDGELLVDKHEEDEQRRPALRVRSAQGRPPIVVGATEGLRRLAEAVRAKVERDRGN